MKVSTQTDVGGEMIGREKTVEMIAKAGFDAWDLSMFDMIDIYWSEWKANISNSPLNGKNYVDYVRNLRRIGEDNGIECCQSHAPFPSFLAGTDILKRALECSAEAGAKICVIHPDNNSSAEENAEMYFKLLPFAKDHGVKIATENMWNRDSKGGRGSAACSDPESFLAHINAVNDDYFVACLDIGHAEMKGLNTSAVEMIRALGKHVQALHIHDNDKIHDDHWMPFTKKIDFVPIVKALKDIGYSGYLTLEADNYLKTFSADNIFEGYKDLAQSVKRLRDMFD